MVEMQQERKIPGLAELVQNQKVFTPMEAKLDLLHHGKYALFSKQQFIAIVDSVKEGYEKGSAECGGVFSLHEIGNEAKKHCGSGEPYTMEKLKEEGLV